MSTELDVIRYYETQQEIITLYAKGTKLTDIQKQTGLKRAEIDQHLAEFREYAKQNRVIQERAKEIVLVVDTHYSDIVLDMHEAIESAKMADDYKTALGGLKAVADVEAKRVELLSKAGILAENAIGDQIVEAEEKQQILVGILRDISKKYPEIGLEISQALSKVTGRVEGVARRADNG